MSPRAPKMIAFAAAATLTSIFFINFCATMFHCGCASLWNGSDAHCNVRTAGVRHCPWCNSVTGSMLPWFLMVAVQAAICFHPRPMSPILRLIAAAAAFPAAGAILAVAYRFATGY